MMSDIDKRLLSVVRLSVRNILSELKKSGYELKPKEGVTGASGQFVDGEFSGQYGKFVEEEFSGRVFHDVSGELRVYVLKAGYRDRWVVVEEVHR